MIKPIYPASSVERFPLQAGGFVLVDPVHLAEPVMPLFVQVPADPVNDSGLVGIS